MDQLPEIFYNLSLYLLILSILLTIFTGAVGSGFFGSEGLWHNFRRYVVNTLLVMVILSTLLIVSGLIVTLDFNLLFIILGLYVGSLTVFALFTYSIEK